MKSGRCPQRETKLFFKMFVLQNLCEMPVACPLPQSTLQWSRRKPRFSKGTPPSRNKGQAATACSTKKETCFQIRLGRLGELSGLGRPPRGDLDGVVHTCCCLPSRTSNVAGVPLLSFKPTLERGIYLPSKTDLPPLMAPISLPGVSESDPNKNWLVRKPEKSWLVIDPFLFRVMKTPGTLKNSPLMAPSSARVGSAPVETPGVRPIGFPKRAEGSSAPELTRRARSHRARTGARGAGVA